MSKSLSIFSALICTFIWGTTFIAQDTGMRVIGPYVFNGVRFFVGFLALVPFYLLLEKKNTYKVIGIYAKRARGLMIHYIIRNRLTDAEALKDFSDEGYLYNQELSSDSSWVYIRD